MVRLVGLVALPWYGAVGWFGGGAVAWCGCLVVPRCGVVGWVGAGGVMVWCGWLLGGAVVWCNCLVLLYYVQSNHPCAVCCCILLPVDGHCVCSACRRFFCGNHTAIENRKLIPHNTHEDIVSIPGIDIG